VDGAARRAAPGPGGPALTTPAPARPPDSETARPPRGSRLWRRAWPWLVAVLLLATLFARLPRAAIERALAAGPAGLLAAFAAAIAALTLAADAAATKAAFRLAGTPRPFGSLLLARGATYLLGLINSAVGQGGLGYYLLRTGTEPGRAFGAVLFIFATHLAAMALVAGVAGGALALGGDGAGFASLGRPGGGPALAAALAALGAGLAAGLAILRLRPPALARRPLLAPLFEAGPGGFLVAAAARVPHVLAMVLGLWGGLRLWGVALPAARGTVLLSAVLLVAALPLAPAGLGTTEVALVALASPYAPAASAAGRQSLVLAFCILYHLFGLAAQAVLALVCMVLLARSPRVGRPGAVC
jgi:hypothetical protein